MIVNVPENMPFCRVELNVISPMRPILIKEGYRPKSQ
jgi:hypothetical protein